METEVHPDWYYPIQGMRTLILGTFPPHKKRWHFEFYYPNGRNRFWKVLEEIGNTKLTEKRGPPAVEQRKMLMQRLLVGVQNVGKVIERRGESASDNDIVIREFQDLLGIINENKALEVILLTGYSGKTNTYDSFMEYLSKKGIKYNKPDEVAAGNKFEVQVGRSITCLIGNSTSPAAGGIVSFESLLEQFRKAIKP